MKVGEVAASAAGDQNFLAQAVGAFEDCNAAAALACFYGAHQSCCAPAENECVEGVGHLVISANVIPAAQGLKPGSIVTLYAALKRRSSTLPQASDVAPPSLTNYM
jgi:hypothetical protein